MTPSTPFAQHVARLRSGDVGAIDQFVARYGPYIRRSIRLRLTQSGLRPVADSEDLCQSVLGTFLIRLAAGEYELNTEADLQHLLGAIARNKLLMLQRRETTQRRDRGRLDPNSDTDDLVAGPEADPAVQIQARDLQQAIRDRLMPEERALFDARRDGSSWEEIAAAHELPESTLRQRLSRALRRVAHELGLEDSDE